MYGWFKIEGVSSLNYSLYIDPVLSFSSPGFEHESVKVPGEEGELILSDGTLNNVQRTIPCYLIGTQATNQLSAKISQWLKKDLVWKKLEFSSDPNYVYEAIYTDQFDVEKGLKNYGKVPLTFKVKPYKFLKNGLIEQLLGSTITNPEERNARPRITIKGKGLLQLTIGSETFSAKGVETGLIIDSLYNTVTDLTGKSAHWEKVTTYPLPVIKPGKQSIVKSNTITEVKIIPRWEAIVG